MKDIFKNKEFQNFLKEIEKNENVKACILFGSHATNKQKPTSDIDICILKDKDKTPKDFENIFNSTNEKYDILFFENLTEIMKFRILTEGKILNVKNKKEFLKLKRKFLHIYRDNYPFYQKNMNKMIANI